MSAPRGNNLLAKYREGKPLTRSQAIEAKCSDCLCGFIDGRVDCKVKNCPLYPWMPYRDR
jgi:hypothetical protein